MEVKRGAGGFREGEVGKKERQARKQRRKWKMEEKEVEERWNKTKYIAKKIILLSREEKFVSNLEK